MLDVLAAHFLPPDAAAPEVVPAVVVPEVVVPAVAPLLLLLVALSFRDRWWVPADASTAAKGSPPVPAAPLPAVPPVPEAPLVPEVPVDPPAPERCCWLFNELAARLNAERVWAERFDELPESP